MKIRPKWADYLVIGIFLLAGLAGLWSNLRQDAGFGQKYVTIHVDNQPVAELSLAENDRFAYSFMFGGGHQNEAVIEVEEGRVRMLPMDHDLCPKGICSHTGWITHAYESIVCLPNRIMVVFSGPSAEDDHDIDGITY